MGWIEDSVEEFRKLPPAGKIAVGGAAVGVAILAYASYRARQNGASASAADAAGSASGSLTGAFPGVTDAAGGVWTIPPSAPSPPATPPPVFSGFPLRPFVPVALQPWWRRAPQRFPVAEAQPPITGGAITPIWTRVAAEHIQSSASAQVNP